MDRSSRLRSDDSGGFRRKSSARSSQSSFERSTLLLPKRSRVEISADVDNFVVQLLLEKFQTEVAPDARRVILTECPAQIRSLLVFAPRLYRFSHRSMFSLRHPHMSYVTWAHQVESGPVRSLYRDSPTEGRVFDRSSVVRWATVADAHDTMIRTSEEDLKLAFDRLEYDAGLQDIIARFWNRLVPVIREDAMKPSVTLSAAAYMYLEAKIADCLFPSEPLTVLDLLDDFESDLRVDSSLSIRDVGGGASAAEGDGEQSDDGNNSDSSLSASNQSTSYDFAPISQLMTLGSDGKQYRNLRGMPSVTFKQFKRSMLELADNWTTSCHPLEFTAFLWDLHSKIFADDWSAEADETITKSNRNRNRGKGGGMFDGVLDPISVRPQRRRDRLLAGQNSVVKRLGAEMMTGEDVTHIMSEEELEALPMEVRQGLLEQQLLEANRIAAEKEAKGGGIGGVGSKKSPPQGRDSSAGSSREERRLRQEYMEREGLSPRQRKLLAPAGLTTLQSKLMALTAEQALDTALQELAHEQPRRSQLPFVHYKKT
jgi:hypothetical protein